MIVSKRAVFVDLYSGEELKRYTSMFSVIWAAAPVIAPFVGGFLQVHFGWRSNFYFLGGLGLLFLAMELWMGGETLREKHSFKFSSITGAYKTMIKARDFSMGIIILGCCYTMIMIYGMTSPFLIENVMHYSPSVTGNAALVSGLSVMAGGLISRRLISKPFYKKVLAAAIAMSLSALIIMAFAAKHASLYTLLAYVVTIHLGGGIVFNSMFSYVLTRFTNMGGKAGGLAGGSYIIITSAISQAAVSLFSIKSQVELGISYLLLIFAFAAIFISTRWLSERKTVTEYKEDNLPVAQPLMD
ncbi:MAG: MFS transporter [Chitinophagaceae bacterium]|nr:MAG: MFS transporter [Chitinophagaceae bacterium]